MLENALIKILYCLVRCTSNFTPSFHDIQPCELEHSLPSLWLMPGTGTHPDLANGTPLQGHSAR